MAETHVYPWWLGRLLTSPLRKARINPDTVLCPYVRPGMTVLDVGCAMGFFSLPMARMVGDGGRVVCVDLQERMIRGLRRRATRARLDTIVEGRLCSGSSLNLSDLPGQVDVALAYGVLHEVQDPERFLAEIHRALRRGGLLLFGEPKAPVSPENLEQELAAIRSTGFDRASLQPDRGLYAFRRRGKPADLAGTAEPLAQCAASAAR